MKLQTLLVTFALLFSSVSYGEQTEYFELEKGKCKNFKLGDLVIDVECTYYKPGSDVPYNGNVTGTIFGSFNNGKKEGIFSNYSGAGDKLSMQNFYTNGVLQYIETFHPNQKVWTKTYQKKDTHINIMITLNTDS